MINEILFAQEIIRQLFGEEIYALVLVIFAYLLDFFGVIL